MSNFIIDKPGVLTITIQETGDVHILVDSFELVAEHTEFRAVYPDPKSDTIGIHLFIIEYAMTCLEAKRKEIESKNHKVYQACADYLSKEIK